MAIIQKAKKRTLYALGFVVGAFLFSYLHSVDDSEDFGMQDLFDLSTAHADVGCANGGSNGGGGDAGCVGGDGSSGGSTSGGGAAVGSMGGACCGTASAGVSDGPGGDGGGDGGGK